MYCTKCGKEIPDGDKKVCEECEKVQEATVSEEKVETKKDEKVEAKKENKKAEKKEKVKKEPKKENKKDDKKSNKPENDGNWKVSGEKNTGIMKKVAISICTIALIAIVITLICAFASSSSNKVGNTIGNIRNYGYATDDGKWIYYLSPNEDSTEIGIFKIKNNGKEKQQIYMSELDIVSLNVYENYIYFIGASTETYTEDDEVDNKIYRIKKDGSDLEVLNDNEINNDCYEIYVLNDSIYYIGLNAEICKMDLNGANKEVVVDNGTGYLGITNKYIIYNTISESEDVDYITYIMNLDGTDAKPIIEGKRLYSVGIEGNYVYYCDQDKKIYRTEIGSNVEELLYENLEAYNLNINDGYAYYLDYLDPENEDYTVCVYRVKLDGTTETPEKIKELETYSSFIDVVGDWVIYMDSSDEAGFINLVNKKGNGEEIEVYRLDYATYYEKMESEDYSDVSVDASNGTTNTVENTVVDNTITNTTTENVVK